MRPPPSDERIIRYVLGEMTEEELTVMEQHIEDDTDFFDLVASVEDELIMQYVCGDMGEDLRLRFEKIYLATPERRTRIEEARKLRAAVRDVAASRRVSSLKPLPLVSTRMRISAAVLIIVVGFAGWMWWRALSHTTTSVAATAQISLTLEPGRDRSALPQSGGQEFVVAPGIREIHFYLKLPEAASYDTYQIIVGTPERPGIFRGPAKLENGTMNAIVPSNLLTVGDYTLELQGVAPDSNPQPVATYYFRSAR